MKKNLLKKLAKGASVALVAGAMVCSASLTSVNAAKTNSDAKAEKQMTKPGKLGVSREGVKANKKSTKNNKKNVRKNAKQAAKGNKKAAVKHARKAEKKAAAKKGGKKLVKRANKKAAKKGARKGTKQAASKKARKAAKKNNVKRTRRHNKKVVKRVNKKSNKRARKSVRRGRRANKGLRRRAEKPMNRRAYRHEQVRRGTKNFRKTRYYHNVWSHAEKVNKKGVIFDLRAAKFDQKKGYKRAAKNARHMAKYLQGYVNHDAHMLNLAK